MSDKIKIVNYSSEDERQRRSEFADVIKSYPIPNDEFCDNLGLFMDSKLISRMKFMDEIYSKITEVPGIVMEFGTRWGQNIAFFSELRAIYEPYNRTRKMVAFDTFSGFPSTCEKDGKILSNGGGMYSVTDNYYDLLDDVMKYHEQCNPLSHIKKYEIVRGDACKEVPAYLERNPETIIALAWFDFDIYEPTKVCLETIKNRLTKGSIVGFDELNDHSHPGETLAVMETLGLNNIRLRRPKYASRVAYFIVE